MSLKIEVSNDEIREMLKKGHEVNETTRQDDIVKISMEITALQGVLTSQDRQIKGIKDEIDALETALIHQKKGRAETASRLGARILARQELEIGSLKDVD